MCYAHQQLSPENDLSMKIDSERYVGVTSIKLNFGEITCSVLPAHHCITECNTTSYPANIGKVRPFDTKTSISFVEKSKKSYQPL